MGYDSVMTTARRFDLPTMLRVLALAALVAMAPARADAPLRTVQVKVGSHALKVEVVANDAQRAKGLMFREKLGRNDGMLFIFEEPAYQSMWMKNTLIPLSVAFLDKDGVILNIRDMQPQTLDTHTSAGPALYAIETNKGWFAERGIREGTKVAGLPRK
jgi:uncharacterized membrane protein (UPF0127 family)